MMLSSNQQYNNNKKKQHKETSNSKKNDNLFIQNFICFPKMWWNFLGLGEIICGMNCDKMREYDREIEIERLTINLICGALNFINMSMTWRDEYTHTHKKRERESNT